MLHLPPELHCRISNTLYTRDIKSLICVCHRFQEIYTDKHIFDLTNIKLYDHQLKGVKFLLNRESAGLNSILNFDTGTGKTAVVMYAYLSRPIPTAIVIHHRHKIIWEMEMKKYNINLPIVIIGKRLIKTDLSQYKRFITDEIQEPWNSRNDITATHIKHMSHGVIWGLTANRINICHGKFTNFHIREIFKTPDCIFSLQHRELEDVVKSKFTLPNFHVIHLIEDIYGFQDINDYQYASRYIYSLILNWRNVFDCELPEYYNKEVRDKIIAYRYKCMLEGIDSVFESPILLRDDIELRGWYNTFDKYVKKLTAGKRAIVYRKAYRVNTSTSHLTNFRVCEEFILGNTNLIALPPSYNAGYNFGKVDIIVIECSGVTHSIFEQIVGRVNRLDQQNTTDIYVVVDNEHDRALAHKLIQSYKREFE